MTDEKRVASVVALEERVARLENYIATIDKREHKNFYDIANRVERATQRAIEYAGELHNILCRSTERLAETLLRHSHHRLSDRVLVSPETLDDIVAATRLEETAEKRIGSIKRREADFVKRENGK